MKISHKIKPMNSMDIQIKVSVVVRKNEKVLLKKVLLIREKLKKKPVALWNVIKGSYNEGETVFEAAKRECKEEASLDVDLTHSLGVYIIEESGKIRVQFNFLAQAKDTKANIASAEEQKSRDEVIEEVRWFAKEEIANMNSEDFVSARAFELLRDWMAGKTFPLEVGKQVGM